MAWGPGFEPGLSDPKSDVLPIRRPPKTKNPEGFCLPGLDSRRQTHACLPVYEGGLSHYLALESIHVFYTEILVFPLYFYIKLLTVFVKKKYERKGVRVMAQGARTRHYNRLCNGRIKGEDKA